MLYKIVLWPEVQELTEISGFEDNSYLVNDVEKFGDAAYFVSVDWLVEIRNLRKDLRWRIHKLVDSNNGTLEIEHCILTSDDMEYNLNVRSIYKEDSNYYVECYDNNERINIPLNKLSVEELKRILYETQNIQTL